jgi:hypothetical protein
MARNIQVFATPTQDAARRHPKNYFGWMLNGAALYRELSRRFALYDGSNARSRPICFETFPHAVTCALAGEIVPAKRKRTVRRQVLADAGFPCELLTNIDFVDAALCALTAVRFAQRRFVHYGDARERFIVAPSAD